MNNSKAGGLPNEYRRVVCVFTYVLGHEVDEGAMPGEGGEVVPITIRMR
jgi:hypothetical protein